MRFQPDELSSALLELLDVSNAELLDKSLKLARITIQKLSRRIDLLHKNLSKSRAAAASSSPAIRSTAQKKSFDMMFSKAHRVECNKKVTEQKEEMDEDATPRQEKHTAQSRCYLCKDLIRQPGARHDTFRNHCQACGDVAVQKQQQKADLRGRLALVTGARIKIGYLTALRLLRCGASVIATSRFEPLMRERFAQEPDASEWMDRLFTYELDLCRPDQVDSFVVKLLATFQHLDILINNAAQTIRRPLHYNLVLQERSNTAAAFSSLLLPAPTKEPLVDSSSNNTETQVSSPAHTSSSSSSSSMVSQGQRSTYQPPIVIPDQDHLSASELQAWFPSGQSDPLNDGEPLDLRPKNTWTVEAEDTDARELAEILITNVHAPITLTVRLLPLLKRSPHKHKYIVQVSSMEGKFARFKTAQHAHTNVGKAALNMWVRTTSYLWAKQYGIAQVAVCTGWCSAMHARGSKQWDDDFETPLTCEDGASRILDPLLGVESGTYAEPFFGVFLKDYKTSAW